MQQMFNCLGKNYSLQEKTAAYPFKQMLWNEKLNA